MQDVAVLDYRAPSLAANSISTHFSGDREAAVVLDVACGTGLVAQQTKRHGFGHFVGIDGSQAMLEVARESGLYQDLKQCMLGEGQLPVQWGLFDVVVIVGALNNNISVKILFGKCKHVFSSLHQHHDNLQYKASLERELKQMEEEGHGGIPENELRTCAD
ncbi:methyltransferase-like protein 27 [Sparus aurata]|uniref:methyltransferase-like protein 27 n=1 Tax=Sparus aurata TaxID=8175 RepID=UPI0011C1B8FF|nr:methyltransferase-like protein 27 [Sparus aurata]